MKVRSFAFVMIRDEMTVEMDDRYHRCLRHTSLDLIKDGRHHSMMNHITELNLFVWSVYYFLEWYISVQSGDTVDVW